MPLRNVFIYVCVYITKIEHRSPSVTSHIPIYNIAFLSFYKVNKFLKLNSWDLGCNFVSDNTQNFKN
jgi:hypothetical protein